MTIETGMALPLLLEIVEPAGLLMLGDLLVERKMVQYHWLKKLPETETVVQFCCERRASR